MIGNASKLLSYPDRLGDLRAGRSVVPITLELQLTDKCNQKCSYCSLAHSDTTMPSEMVRDVLVQAKRIGVEGITVSGGGEPLLGHIDQFRNSPVPSGLITNGGVPSDIFGEFQWVRFSVDSAYPETYQDIRGVAFPDCLRANIVSSSAQNCTGVQMVVCRENKSQCEAMAIWAQSLGARYLHIRPEDHQSNPPWPSDEDLAAAEAQEVAGFRVIARRDKLMPRRATKCYAGHFLMTVTPDGRCWVCACDGPMFCVGDLNKNSLREVICSELRRDTLARVDPSQCRPRCKGASINRALDECWLHRRWL